MFWNNKTLIHSKEFTELFEQMQKIKIQVEMMALELDLTKKKLRISKGIERDSEKETNKNPSIFLNPNGLPIESG